MRIFHTLTSLPPSATGAALALGNFDGVHRGHRAVLSEAVRLARSEGVPAAALTFAPHPREYFDPSLAPLCIYPLAARARLLREAGMDILYILRFDEHLARMSAGEFAGGVLAGQLMARHVITGERFAFGHRRGGDGDYLEAQGKALGFGYTRVPGVRDESGEIISSSRIRGLLAAGDVVAASRLLGRAYAVEGRVREGDKRGRVLGFPTANLALTGIFNPASGVYAVRARLPSGEWKQGVANLGVRPTFGGVTPMLEVHCFDTHADLYGQKITVQPLAYLREERAFASADILKAQILQDCMQAREALARLASEIEKLPA